MCDCISKTQNDAHSYLVAKKQDGQSVAKGYITDAAIMFNSPTRTLSIYEYIVQWNKRGGSGLVTRKKKTNIIHTYCPFCGVKYPE